MIARLALVLVFASSLARADDLEDARTHNKKAIASFALRNYEVAAAEYEAAFQAQPQPALLYNAAQAHRLAGHHKRSLELYESYIRVYGNEISNRSEIDSQIQTLKELIAAAEPKKPGADNLQPTPVVDPRPEPVHENVPPQSVDSPPPPQETPPPNHKPLLIGVVVVVALLVVAGVAVGAVLGSSPSYPTATLGSIRW